MSSSREGAEVDAESRLERVVVRVSSSTTRPELLALLHELKADPFEGDGGVYAEGVGFYFASNGALACVTADYPPENGRCARFAAQTP